MLRKAAKRSIQSRKQQENMIAAETAAFKARGTELRKRDAQPAAVTTAGTVPSLGNGQPQDQEPRRIRTNAVPLAATRRAGGNQRASMYRTGKADEGGNSGADEASLRPLGNFAATRYRGI